MKTLTYTQLSGHEMDAEVNRQDLARELVVNPDVYACQTLAVEYLLKCAIDSYSDDNVLDEEDYHKTTEPYYEVVKWGETGSTEMSDREIEDYLEEHEDTITGIEMDIAALEGQIDTLNEAVEDYADAWRLKEAGIAPDHYESLGRIALHWNDAWIAQRDEIPKIREQIEEQEAELQRARDHVDEVNRLDEQYPEIYEWWLVSSWLASRLEGEREIVIDDGFQSHWWGRQCTGQAIVLDHVIQKIAIELAVSRGIVIEHSDEFDPFNRLPTSPRGAPMGRPGGGTPIDPTKPIGRKRATPTDGDYDEGGAYWGYNGRDDWVWAVWNLDDPGNTVTYVRAAGPRSAIDKAVGNG